MTTSEHELKIVRVEFKEGREDPDVIKFELDFDNEIKEIVDLVTDDGTNIVILSLTVEEYTEFQKAANDVGRRIGATGESVLDLQAITNFLLDHDVLLCREAYGEKRSLEPEQLAKLFEEFARAHHTEAPTEAQSHEDYTGPLGDDLRRTT